MFFSVTLINHLKKHPGKIQKNINRVNALCSSSITTVPVSRGYDVNQLKPNANVLQPPLPPSADSICLKYNKDCCIYNSNKLHVCYPNKIPARTWPYKCGYCLYVGFNFQTVKIHCQKRHSHMPELVVENVDARLPSSQVDIPVTGKPQCCIKMDHPYHKCSKVVTVKLRPPMTEALCHTDQESSQPEEKQPQIQVHILTTCVTFLCTITITHTHHMRTHAHVHACTHTYTLVIISLSKTSFGGY